MKKITFLFLCFLSVLVTAQNISSQYLDKNRVKALISKTNDRFWTTNGGGFAAYEVPKGSGKHAQFVNSIWIGGLDNTNQLHLCANTYKQVGSDYWPGPLDTTNIATFISTVTAKYNRVWKVDCNDIDAFVSAYNSGAVAAGTYTIPEPIRNYPAIGAGRHTKAMEQYNDVNGNNMYDPLFDGDYPIIKGHQQILSIFNDNQYTHTESRALSMGLEIHEKSYAFYEPNIHDTLKAINFTTFYEYTIYNRSANDYHDVYISDWADADIGNYLDDYIGTDTTHQFVYMYNGDNYDQDSLGVKGYRTQPPVASHVMLSDCPPCLTDGIDNNHNGTIDEVNEKFMMDKTSYYNNNNSGYPPETLNPNTKWDYYKYMSGRWMDSTQIKYTGTGYAPTFPFVSNWVYPGNPQTNAGWTESHFASNSPGDRRHFMTSGPFNLPAKKSFVFSYAIVFSQDTVNPVNTISQLDTRVIKDIEHIRYYEKTHRNVQCAPTVTRFTGLGENTADLDLMVYPNPANNQLTIDLDRNVHEATIKLYDVIGRLVKQEKIQDTYRANLNITDLHPGIYILEVTGADKRFIEKIVKE